MAQGHELAVRARNHLQAVIRHARRIGRDSWSTLGRPARRLGLDQGQKALALQCVGEDDLGLAREVSSAES